MYCVTFLVCKLATFATHLLSQSVPGFQSPYHHPASVHQQQSMELMYLAHWCFFTEWIIAWLQQRVTVAHALSIDWMKSYQLPVPCTNCVHLKTHKSGHSVHDCCSAVISNLESSQCSVQWTILFAFAAWCSRGVLEWPLMPYILYTFGFCCHQQDFSLIKAWFYFY